MSFGSITREDGQSTVEYGLVLVLVCGGILLLAYTGLGAGVGALIDDIGAALAGAI